MLRNYETEFPARSSLERTATQELCQCWKDDQEVSPSRNNNISPWMTTQVVLNRIGSKCKEAKRPITVNKKEPIQFQKAKMADVSTQVCGAVLVGIRNVDSTEMIPLKCRKVVRKHVSYSKMIHLEKENGLRCLKSKKFTSHCNLNATSKGFLPTMQLSAQYKVELKNRIKPNMPVVISRKKLYIGLHSLDKHISAKSIL